MLSRLNVATYPVAGAVIGTAVGGPIGMLAGLKVGAIVAIGCGVVGYVVGKVTKTQHSNSCEEQPPISSENSESLQAKVNTVDKKDI